MNSTSVSSRPPPRPPNSNHSYPFNGNVTLLIEEVLFWLLRNCARQDIDLVEEYHQFFTGSERLSGRNSQTILRVKAKLMSCIGSEIVSKLLVI